MTGMPALRIDAGGSLILSTNGEEHIFDFNACYKGFFPCCRWTCTYEGNLLYMAGTDEYEIPHLFSSIGGEVWTEVCIGSRNSFISEREYGDILRILYDEKSRQIFLVTRKGCLVTLPDCPKCVRVRHISSANLVDGRIEDGVIVLTDEKGAQSKISLCIAVQYQCTYAFAKSMLKDGGVVIDLRSRESHQTDPILPSLSMDFDEIDDMLQTIPKYTPLFFFCRHGYQADQAALIARRGGFEKAYSLGSVYDIQRDLERGEFRAGPTDSLQGSRQ